MLYDMNNQLIDIQATLSNLRYEEFALRNKFAADDEYNASMDLERQQAWFDDAEAEYNALVEQRDALKQADGTFAAED